MSLVSKETWNKFTEEEKKNVKKEYLKWQEEAETNPYFEGKISNMEDLFDKENLQSGPEIKTWKDVVENNPNCNYQEYLDSISEGPGMALGINPICKKMIATYKIAKLIELGYGGIVSKEEWADKELCKWYIAIGIDGKLQIGSSYENWQEFISFHTKKQAAEFMSYPENNKLIQQYYMMI